MEEVHMDQKESQQSEQDFEVIVETYKPYIEKLAFQFGIQPDAIPDVVQDTFINIHRNLHRFKGGKFTTWLYPITLNVVRDRYRKKQRERRIFKKASKEYVRKPDYFYFEHEDYELFHEAVKQLHEKYRMPIILFYFHEQSYEEIAEILRLKVSAVKTRMHRGRKKLKENYQKLKRREEHADG